MRWEGGGRPWRDMNAKITANEDEKRQKDAGKSLTEPLVKLAGERISGKEPLATREVQNLYSDVCQLFFNKTEGKRDL